jgi:hypothetical protein
MAALSPANLVIRALENVGRVSGDEQCPADVIERRANDEYRSLRRRLSAEFPTLYEALSSETTLTTTAVIAKPTDCETVRLVERKSGNQWFPLEVAQSYSRSYPDGLSFYERGADLIITPTELAPGVYRVHYVKTPASPIVTYDVPDGLETIIVELVSAWIRQRQNEVEQVNYHLAQAKRIWDENYSALRRRYGSHSASALKRERRRW